MNYCFVCGKPTDNPAGICDSCYALVPDELINDVVIADIRPMFELGNDLVMVVASLQEQNEALMKENARLETAIAESERVRREESDHYERLLAENYLVPFGYVASETGRTTHDERQHRIAHGWIHGLDWGDTEVWYRPARNGNGSH